MKQNTLASEIIKRAKREARLLRLLCFAETIVIIILVAKIWR